MADQRALGLVQEDRPAEFNRFIEPANNQVDLSNGVFRGYDLRKFHLNRANLQGAYLRNADLRGLDLSEANLDGASMKDAKISGTLFPRNLSAQEIQLSLAHGNRVRQGI